MLHFQALLSTGFIPPKKNILLSIGSFKEKQEFLPSVWKLHRLGFSLYATSGGLHMMAFTDSYDRHGRFPE